MILSEEIRKVRRSKRLTQSTLAKRSGVNVIQICKYENGKNIPSDKILVKLARGMELPDNYFTRLLDTEISDTELINSIEKLSNSLPPNSEARRAVFHFINLIISNNK